MALARSGWTVGVVGRDVKRLRGMEEEARDLDGAIHPIVTDYEDTDQYAGVLREYVEAHEPVRVLVSWVHGGAEDALAATIREVERKPLPARTLLEVRAAGVDGTAPPPSSQLHLGAGWTRSLAQLGFRDEHDGRQTWLTDREIADGLARAVADGEPALTLGNVPAWSVEPAARTPPKPD
jgi:NAD(P)-dependent dehydrogenase (short-subunit alcohol dehydrogenase family)